MTKIGFPELQALTTASFKQNFFMARKLNRRVRIALLTGYVEMNRLPLQDNSLLRGKCHLFVVIFF